MLRYILTLVAISIITSTTTAQKIYSQSVQFDYKNQTLHDILLDIENRYNIAFTYSNVDLTTPTSIQYKGSFRKGLAKILFPQNIQFKYIGGQIVLQAIKQKRNNIKGQIIDIDSHIPLIGADILLLNTDPLLGESADINGYFTIPDVLLGRYDIQVQYLGYETVIIPQVLLTVGKELFLNIEMKESIVALNDIVVTARMNEKMGAPLNDMATVSARSFSIEESQRFAASLSDPARMVQSFAGISNGGDDLSNEIIIRGNNARGLLWQLEGIEIPNPNHFADYVSGGGAITMLSANILSTSDFYAGAFPAEYGNAMSGVFDLKMRNGNKDRREHSLAVGLLGVEASTEGYFSKKSDASYLVNYRYSTIELIDNFLVTLDEEIPKYQDLAFKINLPTKKAGRFSFFGMGGENTQNQTASRDSADWTSFLRDLDVFEGQRLGFLGLKHQYIFNNKTYVQSSLLSAAYNYEDLAEKVFHQDEFPKFPIDKSDFRTYEYRGKFVLNHKKNAQHQFKLGASLEYERFSFAFKGLIFDSIYQELPLGTDSTLISFLNARGSTEFLQSFFQWKNRFHKKWELNTGFHFSYLFLNNTFTIDPRAAISWNFKKDQKLTLAAGMHSKPEHISTYFIQPSIIDLDDPFPNTRLKMPRSFHLITGYDNYFNKDLRINIEAYFQYLRNIPVSANPTSAFSILNNTSIFNFIFGNDAGQSKLVSEGKGYNYGIDITLEKRFNEGYYWMTTASIFDSKYTTLDKRIFNTAYANNFLFNIIGGKEWKFNPTKQNRFGINGKLTIYGGQRTTPIDLEASLTNRRPTQKPNAFFSEKLDPYIRFDFAISYKINRDRSTHALYLDFQNLPNRRNVQDEFVDFDNEIIRDDLGNGIIPFVTYKVEFVFDERE